MWNLIKKRRKIKDKLSKISNNSVNTEDFEQEYRKVNRKVKNSMSNDKTIWADSLIRKAEEETATYYKREVYQNPSEKKEIIMIRIL